MRHIEIQAFKPSEEWQKDAKEATDELLAKATPDERSDYIRKNSDIWKALGKELIAYFGNKCWYPDEPFATVAASCLHNSPFEWARVLATQPSLRHLQIQNTVPNTGNSCQV